MSSISSQHEEYLIDFALAAHNADTGESVKESLEILEKIDVPVEQYGVYNVANLARRYLITNNVKEQARKLLAKVRRVEGQSKMVKRAGSMSGSSSDEGSLKRKRSTTPEEDMLTSKRTRPTIITGKRRTSGEDASSSLKPLVEEKNAESRLKAQKTAELDDKLQKFLERKKAGVTAKKPVKPVSVPSEALSVVGAYRQQRMEQAKMARETGQWPVQKKAAGGRRRRY